MDTGGFLGMLASLAARAIPLATRVLPTIMSGLATGLLSGSRRLVVLLSEMDYIYTSMISATEYKN